MLQLGGDSGGISDTAFLPLRLELRPLTTAEVVAIGVVPYDDGGTSVRSDSVLLEVVVADEWLVLEELLPAVALVKKSLRWMVLGRAGCSSRARIDAAKSASSWPSPWWIGMVHWRGVRALCVGALACD